MRGGWSFWARRLIIWTRNVAVWTRNVVVWTRNVVVWARSVVVWARNVVVWARSVTVRARPEDWPCGGDREAQLRGRALWKGHQARVGPGGEKRRGQMRV